MIAFLFLLNYVTFSYVFGLLAAKRLYKEGAPMDFAIPFLMLSPLSLPLFVLFLLTSLAIEGIAFIAKKVEKLIAG